MEAVIPPLWNGGNHLAINTPLVSQDSNLNIESDHACCNGLHMCLSVCQVTNRRSGHERKMNFSLRNPCPCIKDRYVLVC
jgi:hypothetical protein